MGSDTQQQAADTVGAAPSGDLAALRQRAQELLAAQRKRIREVEETLSEQVSTLRAHLENESLSSPDTRQEAEQLLNEAREGLTAAMEQQSRLRVELSEAKARAADLEAELERAKQQLQTQAQQLEAQASSATEATDDSAELAELLEAVERLEGERNQLQEQLSATTGSSGDESADDVIRERFELAVQELREVKVLNENLNDEVAHLREQVSQARADATDVAPSSDIPKGGFDWETQKAALMEQMEADFDESDEAQAQEKLTVAGTIRITDEVVAEKDREIQELQRLLANQSSNLGEMAVGAVAIADVLDHDELIRDERENLRRLQEEWREKLRQAEVEISVERAKFARDRIELDEQVRALEGERASLQPNEGKSGKKKARGNWLSRLGLKDDS